MGGRKAEVCRDANFNLHHCREFAARRHGRQTGRRSTSPEAASATWPAVKLPRGVSMANLAADKSTNPLILKVPRS